MESNGGGPRPVGFPGCRVCPYRSLDRPDVCLSCLEASPGQSPPPGLRRCPTCEQIVRRPGACPTRWCGRTDRGWSVVWSVGVHEGGLRRAVVRYKYGGERWWAEVFGRLLAGWMDRRAPWLEDFDLVVPMPAYTGPGARRDWDPVATIVAVLGSVVGPGWEIDAGVIRKVRETAPMRGRPRGDRERTAAGQLRGALRVPDRARVAGARIVVVDDVLAEGSTLREVAMALRGAGAAEVAGLVLGRPDWRATGGPPPGRTGSRIGPDAASGVRLRRRL